MFTSGLFIGGKGGYLISKRNTERDRTLIKTGIAFFAKPFDPFLSLFVFALLDDLKRGIQRRIVCVTDRAKSVSLFVIPDSVFKREAGPCRMVQAKKFFYDGENYIDHAGHIFLSARGRT
jgi:hypothetical protein